MRFGGHETFAIREGWLHKGLALLKDHPDRLYSEDASDWLGVGRNMAKSIRHWLLATELACYPDERKGGDRNPQISELGRIIWKGDKYFIDPGTLWILHSNLVRSKEQAYSWYWFFNGFSVDRFEKSLCLDALRRVLRLDKQKMPTDMTLDRDVTCLLATYARPIPFQPRDPEEAQECPFAELGLLTHHTTSGYYELNRRGKDIPPHVFAYVLATGFDATDVPLTEATHADGSAGRIFALTAEALMELAVACEHKLGTSALRISGLAGERIINLDRRPRLQWLVDYYAARTDN